VCVCVCDIYNKIHNCCVGTNKSKTSIKEKNRPYTNNNGCKRERGACGTNGLSSPVSLQRR